MPDTARAFNPAMRLPSLPLSTLLVSLTWTARAELRVPAIFGDHMVLQQKQANPVWGWDTPGTEVTVQFAGQTKSAKAGPDGKWTVKLDPAPANTRPATLSIQGSSARQFQDVLVGEVWVCSGQSNMGFTLSGTWDAELDKAQARHPRLRLITVPRVGTQEPQDDFKGAWQPCTPENAGAFTAVGYHFGRMLHQMLDVPVGLINNAWGGSACEAWVSRDVLEKDGRFGEMMARWRQTEQSFTQEGFDKQMEAHKAKAAAWLKERQQALKSGARFTKAAPRAPQNPMTGQHRPGNLYAGVLHPTIGYGIKGAIWYQGETNAARAHEYGHLFPLMIQHWRSEWKQGDFPFYWVQLADYLAEKPEPGDSSWAELRESQTKTQNAVKNGGQAVIIDLGEANDIHPKNKRDVAERLARIALARDYGVDIRWRSPEFKSAEFQGGKAVVTLDTFGSSLRTVDVSEVKGFALCGEDRKWVWAGAKLLGKDKVEVSAKGVPNPVAVRYAWSDNPACNLFSVEGLPVTPFRSDDFPMITAPAAQ